MDVLGTVEIWGATSADTIATENLDSALFKHFIGDEVEVVVGSKVVDCAAIGELDFWASGANDDRALFVLGGFELGGGRDEGLGGPVFD